MFIPRKEPLNLHLNLYRRRTSGGKEFYLGKYSKLCDPRPDSSFMLLSTSILDLDFDAAMHTDPFNILPTNSSYDFHLDDFRSFKRYRRNCEKITKENEREKKRSRVIKVACLTANFWFHFALTLLRPCSLSPPQPPSPTLLPTPSTATLHALQQNRTNCSPVIQFASTQSISLSCDYYILLNSLA